MLTSASLLAAPDKDVIIKESELPAKAREFIKAHFKNAAVNHAKRDSDSYDVYLSNGFKVEFKRNGEWKEVNGEQAAVPQSVLNLLPGTLTTYLKNTYSSETVTKVKVERRGYELELYPSDVELTFSKKGELVDVDY